MRTGASRTNKASIALWPCSEYGHTTFENQEIFVQDLIEIDRLLTEYCFAIDTGRLEDCAALFEHAEFSFEGFATVHGKAGVMGILSGIILHEDGTPRTRHILSNVRIDVADDGTSAKGQSYVTTLQQAGDQPLQAVFTGHYFDKFKKIDNKWAFVKRGVFGPHFGDMSRHMRGM